MLRPLFMNSPFRWIDSTSWELDLFGLPHQIPWPADADEKSAAEDPFDSETLVRGIELMGDEAGEPWIGFKRAYAHFEELSEALEDSEIRRAREILGEIEAVHPGTSFRIFHEANIAQREGRFDDAIALFQQAAEKTPLITEIWNNLGVVFAMTGRREEAVAAFRKVLAIDQNNHVALEGMTQVRELVKLMRDAADPKSAMYVELPVFKQMAAKQIDAISGDAAQLLTYGEELVKTGMVPDVGLSALEKARDLQPEDPRTLFTLASAYRAMGKIVESRTIAVRMTELLPESDEAFFHLAQICNAMEDSAAERAALGRAVELNPNMQAALAVWFQLKPGEHDPAKEQQLLDFAESKNSWMAFILASALCRERGDFKRAMKLAERAVDLAPDSEEALLHFTATIGDAKDIAKLAKEVKPKVISGKFSRRLVWNYAHVLRQVGLAQDALAALKKAASGDAPDDFKAACVTTIEAWSGMLTGTGVPLEVHQSGVLLRDVLLTVDDDDGGVVLSAGARLPEQGSFKWRADGVETSVFLQQGQSGGAPEPQSLGEFKIRGIQTQPDGPTTIECHITALADGALHFRAAQNGRRLPVGWAPPRVRV